MEEYFSLDFISETYESRVRPKSGRGLDRVSVVDFEKSKEEQFEIIRRKCLNSSYRFTPYLQRLILKGPKKFPRSISIPTVRDKIVLSILNSALQKAFPKCVNRELPNVKVRSFAEAFNRNESKISIHRVDIKSYYDSINREILFEMLDGSIGNVFNVLIFRAINNATVPYNYYRKNRKEYINTVGVPQGLPISNILAEIYLDDFDIEIISKCEYYDRYVDDIIALTDVKFDFEKSCTDALKNLNLKINKEKTMYSCDSECINFLGYTISEGEISVKKSTLEKHFHSIAMMFVRLRKAVYIDNKITGKKIGKKKIKKTFLEDLNVKIAGAKYQNKRYGWLPYFSEITDEKVLYLVDNFVRGQFDRCKEFTTIPRALKKASRAYWELKYNWRDTDYLFDYESLDVKEKRRWLTNRGLSLGTFTEEEIDRLYSYHVGRFLSQIEKDMGVEYKI